MSHSRLSKLIKKYFSARIMEIIKTDPKRASDPRVDSTFISTIVRISYLVRTVKMVSLILLVSFFLGLLWYVFC